MSKKLTFKTSREVIASEVRDNTKIYKNWIAGNSITVRAHGNGFFVLENASASGKKTALVGISDVPSSAMIAGELCYMAQQNNSDGGKMVSPFLLMYRDNSPHNIAEYMKKAYDLNSLFGKMGRNSLSVGVVLTGESNNKFDVYSVGKAESILIVNNLLNRDWRGGSK